MPGLSATPLGDAYKRLVSTEVRHTLGFRRAAFGVHFYEGVHPDVRAFKRAFEKVLGEVGIAAYAVDLRQLGVMFDFFRAEPMTPVEWNILCDLADPIIRRLELGLEFDPMIAGWFSVSEGSL
jgi:hypothetical protein